MKSCEAALWNGLVAKWRLSHRLVTSDKATKTHHPPGPRSIKIHQDPSRSIKIHRLCSFPWSLCFVTEAWSNTIIWGDDSDEARASRITSATSWISDTHDVSMTHFWHPADHVTTRYDGLKKQWTFGELHFKFLHTVSPCNLYFLHCIVLIYTQVSPLEEFYTTFSRDLLSQACDMWPVLGVSLIDDSSCAGSGGASGRSYFLECGGRRSACSCPGCGHSTHGYACYLAKTAVWTYSMWDQQQLPPRYCRSRIGCLQVCRPL